MSELCTLVTNDINVEGKIYQFKTKAFVCDAPARALIKGTVGHTGYYSCDKCTIRGIHYKGRIVLNSEIFQKRTDRNFRRGLYQHHVKEATLLQNLPIDIVKDFSLDVMHLVFLGVVKRYLMYLSKAKIIYKFNNSMLNKLNARLNLVKGVFPRNFSRQPRPIDTKRWKATEYRCFLLYLGPALLKGIMKKTCGKAFYV